ncbi:hypothetical protein BC829DRAFT_441785 [Chytridium lagenaria]|nr:hypothetical protein BC829DRAFT_441785 [Chytridium lagenaria]
MKFLKPRLTDEWAADMKTIDIFWYCAITGIYQLECFMKNDKENLEKFHIRQKEVHHLIPTVSIVRLGSSVKVNEVFVLILREASGNTLLEASMEALKEIIEIGVGANHHATAAAALSVCIAILGLCSVGTPLDADYITRLLATIATLLKEMKVMSRYSWMAKFATLLGFTSKYHLLKSPSKSVKLTRRLMGSAEFKDKIDMGGDLCFVGACCCAIIALSSLDECEARLNRNRAIDMFEEMGFLSMTSVMVDAEPCRKISLAAYRKEPEATEN